MGDPPVFHQRVAQSSYYALRDIMQDIPELGGVALVFHWNGLPDDPNIPFFLLIDRSNPPHGQQADPFLTGNVPVIQGLQRKVMALSQHFARLEVQNLALRAQALHESAAALQRLKDEFDEVQKQLQALPPANQEAA